MQKEFEKYLKNVCRCSTEKKFLLAISGGIDSVVMAEMFHRAGLEFAMAHCNFGLRGIESDGDQEFVEKLASRLQVACYAKRFETQAFADSHNLSIQMAARELRYTWFQELREKHGYDFVVVGHNRNDIVETVLMNFARGSGIRGLTGIKPRLGTIVRPMLFASRSEIVMFANTNNLPWREDSSNAETKYTRNRVRHVIIPEFEVINPAFLTNAMETILRLNQTEQLLQLTISNIKKSVWIELSDKYLIDIDKLLEFPAVETILFELLKEFGSTQLLIKSIIASFESTPGKRFFTKTHCITRDRTHLIITKNVLPALEELLIDEETALISYPIHLTLNNLKLYPGFVIPAESNFAVLDQDKLIFPLKLRHWKAGDSFHPFGMKGSKKISDFLINSKVPLPDKQHVWVLESSGNIVWVVNHRIDNGFRITSQTQQVMLIEYKQMDLN
jgi:tRNA(Ile)-lysidine synthase